MANVYFGDTFGAADDNWNTSIQFTVSGVGMTPTAGAIYSNNGIQFTVTSASIASGSGTINAGGSGTSAASGTLTKVSGTGAATISFSAKADVNWFSTPGSVFGACSDTCNPGFNVPGTPLGRLPTLADTVIVGNTINVPSYITPWTSAITVSTVNRAGDSALQGILNAGTFTNTVTSIGGGLGGSIICNGAVTGTCNIRGGTFTNTVTGLSLNISGSPIFSSTVTIGTTVTAGSISISGNPIFNGTFINPRGTTGRHSGSFYVTSGNPVFNCAIPNNMLTYELRAGTYDRELVLGLVSPTVSPGCFITIGAGFSTSQNVTLNSKRTTGNGSITITGGEFTGRLTINKAASISLRISGGSYSPPAVTTPAIKSGSNMTFSYAAVPASYGFGANGSTFNPTILLSGTTNDMLGSGLQ